MILAIAALAVSFLAGFGAGRVKNAAKLAAVKTELSKAEGSVVAEVAKLVAPIKAKL